MIAAACGKTEEHAAPILPAVAVTLVTAHVEPLTTVYRTSGTVRGRVTVTITSRVAGYVRAIEVNPGDQVVAGQLLVQLEANDVRAAVTRQHAELASAIQARAEAASAVDAARSAAKLAKISYGRQAELLAKGAAAQQAADDAEAEASGTVARLESAQARLRASQAGIAAAEAALAESQATLGYARVTAPFAGRVIERRVDPGALASPATPLLVLDDGARPRVETAVEESRAAEIRIGDAAELELGNLPAPVIGTISEIVPNIDVLSRAFLVKIDPPENIGTLQPGAFARVGFRTGAQPRLVVPTTAITPRGALDRVFVADGGIARLRIITRGGAQGPWTEVLSGLDPGEQVIADPASVHDGDRIEVRR